jgi:hypothetical protein
MPPAKERGGSRPNNGQKTYLRYLSRIPPVVPQKMPPYPGGMDATTLLSDPAGIVEGLDPATIAARIDELERQQAALRVLLRAARERRRRRPGQATQRQEVRHG